MEALMPLLCAFYPSISPWNIGDLTLDQYVSMADFALKQTTKDR